MKRTLILVAVMVFALGIGANASWVVYVNTTAHSTGQVTIANANNNAPTEMINSAGNQTWMQLPGGVGDNTGVAGKYYYRMFSTSIVDWTFHAFVESADADPSMTVKVWGPAIADLVGQKWGLKDAEGTVLASGVWAATNTSDANPVFSYTWADTSGMVGSENAFLCTLGPVTDEPIVPEPGSMLAMFTGIVGLAGFAIRRKK